MSSIFILVIVAFYIKVNDRSNHREEKIIKIADKNERKVEVFFESFYCGKTRKNSTHYLKFIRPNLFKYWDENHNPAQLNSSDPDIQGAFEIREKFIYGKFNNSKTGKKVIVKMIIEKITLEDKIEKFKDPHGYSYSLVNCL